MTKNKNMINLVKQIQKKSETNFVRQICIYNFKLIVLFKNRLRFFILLDNPCIYAHLQWTTCKRKRVLVSS